MINVPGKQAIKNGVLPVTISFPEVGCQSVAGPIKRI
jgi:hypothetical protein